MSSKQLDITTRALRLEVESRKQAEERLTHHLEAERLTGEARLRSYFDAAPQAILAVSETGAIKLVNLSTEQMFGYSRIELLGQPIEMLLPEALRAAHVEHRKGFYGQPHTRTSGHGLALSGRRKDGSEFPVEVGLGFVNTEEGVLGLGLVTDITAVTRTAHELRRSNEELEQFAYLASHDLQEPLRMVTGYLELLERRYRDQLDDDAREFIRIAVDGAARMRGLIKDLLRFSRVGTQAVEIRGVPCAGLLKDAVANLEAAIEGSGAQVTWDEMPVIPADPGLLTQVFQNLIANAIKFQKTGAPEIHVSAQFHHGEHHFSVRDNGIGIEKDHADRIFRIFERLHSADTYPGTGVGLAITKRIVERHGGRIWLESTPGAGCTFFFSVPANPGVQATGRAAGSGSL